MVLLSVFLAFGIHGPQEVGGVFAPPVRLDAGGVPLAVEDPGYAAPTWHDVDGDGRPELVVGQFAGGRIRVHRQVEAGRFAAGEWLRAGGEIAEVPGVW